MLYLLCDLKMFGVYFRKTDDRFFILTNEKHYKTEERFIPKEKYNSLPMLYPGSKVSYDGKEVKLTDFDNCKRCHKMLNPLIACSCLPEKTIYSSGELIKSEYSMYDTGIVLTVAIRCDDKVVNAVLFKNNAMKNVLDIFEVGDTVKFKAIIINEGSQHDLVKIFAVKI